MACNSYPGTTLLKDDEIRLIRLLPGHWEDEIRCELVHDSLKSLNSLQHGRTYHALSHVWGLPENKRPITLDGVIFNATVNLESALRHLRHQLPGRLLWVDALCINQRDIPERTHQVKLMGAIYRSCESVLVYLGDGVGPRKFNHGSKANQCAPPTTIYFDDENDMPHIQRFLQGATTGMPDNVRDPLDREMRDTVKVFSFIRTLSWVEHLADLASFALSDDDRKIHGGAWQIFEALGRLTRARHTPWWGRV